MKLLGVVLCGGRSTRMGRDKASLILPDGGTFLQHAITRLTSICDDVVVSGKSSAMHEQTTIRDPQADQGPAVGIATALRYADEHSYAACFVTPVDTPALSIDDLGLIERLWRETGRPTFAESDRLQPLIGIYTVSLVDSLNRLSQSEDRSLIRWLRQHDPQTVPLSRAACHNINTPHDLSDA